MAALRPRAQIRAQKRMIKIIAALDSKLLEFEYGRHLQVWGLHVAVGVAVEENCGSLEESGGEIRRNGRSGNILVIFWWWVL